MNSLQDYALYTIFSQILELKVELKRMFKITFWLVFKLNSKSN